MNVRLFAAGAVAALFAACTLNASLKTSCTVDGDCINGDVCIDNHCATKIGGGGTSGHGGNIGTLDGGYDGLVPRVCPASPVNACPASDGGGQCAETYCGGHLWRNAFAKSLLVNYRIVDSANRFSDSYKNAIRASAAAWARAASPLVTIKECIPATACTNDFISVVPADGPEDGIRNPGQGEQFLPMPAETGGRVSPHKIAHQWGHVLGLAHTYQRADRDRYMGFDPELWCPSGLPPLCAANAPQELPGRPAVVTGTFGVFDGKSKMNGLPSQGICGGEEPDEDSGEPTLGDLSALSELTSWVLSGWSPFQPIGRLVSPTQPLDYQLAAGVDPTGSPALAEIDYAGPEIFVRGTDDRVYMTTRRDPMSSSTAQWQDKWTAVEDDVDSDPAVVSAWLAKPPILFLATRSRLDGQIHLRAGRGIDWGASTSLGAPAAGAASAPALASESPTTLAVFVRGGDGLIYWLNCRDADAGCAGSASGPAAWTALHTPPSPTGIFVGKPSAIWLLDRATGLTVAAVGDDRRAFFTTGLDTGLSDWIPATSINAEIASDDPDPGVAIAMMPTPGDLAFFARNQKGLLSSQTTNTTYFPIGGVLASPPGVVRITVNDGLRTDVAAIIDDHGHPGVWWRYGDVKYDAPCYYNAPGAACLTCGSSP